jgi:tetratricopeptide (TPR) repeat protein
LVRYQSFFDALATPETDSAEWKSGLAGLATLRLIDAASEDSRLVHSDLSARGMVRETVAALSEGDPIRGILARVLDELDKPHPEWKAIAGTLVTYGRALDFDGRWTMATSAFEIASEIAGANGAWSVAVEADIALGGSARRAGDWKKSHAGYAQALYLATGLGDTASSLTVRIGMANSQLARGNFPEADRLLSAVVDEANAEGLDEVAADALHSRASVAHNRRRFAEAVAIGYEALRKASNPTRKDAVLADLAACFAELGMRDAARDAHLIVAVTSRSQWVRWQAGLNLMELAAIGGAEDEFDRYASELSTAELPPRLRSYYLLYRGMGSLGFGREQEGTELLQEAERFASLNGIHQVSFEAENALSRIAELMRAPSAAVTTRDDDTPLDTQDIAESLSHLREMALSSTLPV